MVKSGGILIFLIVLFLIGVLSIFIGFWIEPYEGGKEEGYTFGIDSQNTQISLYETNFLINFDEETAEINFRIDLRENEWVAVEFPKELILKEYSLREVTGLSEVKELKEEVDFDIKDKTNNRILLDNLKGYKEINISLFLTKRKNGLNIKPNSAFLFYPEADHVQSKNIPGIIAGKRSERVRFVLGKYKCLYPCVINNLEEYYKLNYWVDYNKQGQIIKVEPYNINEDRPISLSLNTVNSSALMRQNALVSLGISLVVSILVSWLFWYLKLEKTKLYQEEKFDSYLAIRKVLRSFRIFLKSLSTQRVFYVLMIFSCLMFLLYGFSRFIILTEKLNSSIEKLKLYAQTLIAFMTMLFTFSLFYLGKLIDKEENKV